MRVMMLGAGYNQLHAIRKIRERGHTAIVSDYDPASPGKAIGDEACLASTFSLEETLDAARRCRVDALYTSGSDQPVLIAAEVARRLGLPSALDVDTARLVTDKLAMKRRFAQQGLDHAPWRTVSVSDTVRSLEGFGFPAVLKPVDSQGQRGVCYVRTPQEVLAHRERTLSHSRADKALLETYLPSEELCVTGWVTAGRLHILSVTDRIRFREKSLLGICTAHRYPSIWTKSSSMRQAVEALSRRIVQAFGIPAGPVYFQILRTSGGLFVNEIACRIGGAFEDVYCERCLGLDLAALQLRLAVGETIRAKDLEGTVFPRPGTHFSVELLFCRPGTVARHTPLDDIVSLPGVVDAGIQLHPGERVRKLDSARQRAGHAIVQAPDERTLARRIQRLYTTLRIEDDQGHNLLMEREGIRDER